MVLKFFKKNICIFFKVTLVNTQLLCKVQIQYIRRIFCTSYIRKYEEYVCTYKYGYDRSIKSNRKKRKKRKERQEKKSERYYRAMLTLKYYLTTSFQANLIRRPLNGIFLYAGASHIFLRRTRYDGLSYLTYGVFLYWYVCMYLLCVWSG